MNVRTLNGSGSGSILARPPNGFVAVSVSAGFQDLDEGTARSVDNISGLQAVAYSGTTAQRPASIPQNPLGLSVFVDTSLNIVVAQDGNGVWRNIVTGAPA